MLKYPYIFGYYFLLLISAFINAEITVRVALDASFRVDIFPQSLDHLTNCTLTDPRDLVTVIPITINNENETSEINDTRIVPLGNDLCGARIHNLTYSDAGRWTLIASNSTESITKIFRTVVSFWETPVNVSSTSVIGDMSKTITCGPSTILYCELRNPLGNKVALTSTSRCETVINIVKPSDFGVWTCTVGVSGSMDQIYATHTLNIGDPAEEIVIYTNQTSLGTLITWQVKETVQIVSWCRAFPPNGNSIMVQPGLELEKYVAVGTDFGKKQCGLLVKGEISEEYQGLWRLEIGINMDRTFGGFIRIPGGEIPGPNDPNVPTTPSETVRLKVVAGNSFTITCQTQYTAGYCWIKGPQGQIITSTDELTVGRCSGNINSAIVGEHNGTWTCNMAHINGGHEEHFLTEVQIIDKWFETVSPEITVPYREKTVIACRSVLDSPLQYCRFVRPDGVGLGVAPGMEPSGRYSYEGPGLDYGYCGLAISSVEAIDIGEWTCVSRSRFRTWEAENSDKCILRTPEISTASIVGMSMGAIIFAIIVAGVVFVRYRRKKLQRNSEESMIIEFNNN